MAAFLVGRPVAASAAGPMLTTVAGPAVRRQVNWVHLDLAPNLLPDDYVLLTIDLDEPAVGRLTRLPADPVAFGNDWLREQRTPVLQVPSLIVPKSPNLLLNPAHPVAAQASIGARRRFAFDHRLWLPR